LRLKANGHKQPRAGALLGARATHSWSLLVREEGGMETVLERERDMWVWFEDLFSTLALVCGTSLLDSSLNEARNESWILCFSTVSVSDTARIRDIAWMLLDTYPVCIFSFSN
jgi:hypothetical protein